MTFADKFGQDRLTMLKLDPEKKHYSIDARDIYGFFLDDDIMANMIILFTYQPVYHHKHRLNTKRIALDIKSIKFVTKEKL